MTQNRVFIRNIPFEITKEELIDKFREFGTIKDCFFQEDRGFAFISFSNSNEYNKCLDMNEKMEIMGRIIGIHKATKNDNQNNFNAQKSEESFSKKETGSTDTLFVGNIPNDVEDFEIREIFMEYRPYEIKLCDSNDVQFALVRIFEPELLEKAMIELDGYKIRNQRIYIEYANTSFR